jgi:hypothetical protein
MSFANRHFCAEKAKEAEGWKCQMSFEESRRDAVVKTDVKYLAYAVSFIKVRKEEKHSRIEGPRKKEEMVGLEPTNGPV